MESRNTSLVGPFLILAAACGALAAYACTSNTSPDGSNGEAAPATAAAYTCPMHADVRSDAPGTCPTCGMALVAEE